MDQVPERAKRMECAELAPAVERPGSSKAGASSAHSPAGWDFATHVRRNLNNHASRIITPMPQLTNQIAVVTGAGRGIGRAIALKFAAEGADVACVSRTVENSEKVANEIRALGRKAWAYAVDVAMRWR